MGGVPRPNIRVVAERPAMAIVDGDNGMGHLVMSFATALAIEKARTQGAPGLARVAEITQVRPHFMRACQSSMI
jgi:LDH2 family malate/lactate/ureidoglycolate dehydrogenase